MARNDPRRNRNRNRNRNRPPKSPPPWTTLGEFHRQMADLAAVDLLAADVDDDNSLASGLHGWLSMDEGERDYIMARLAYFNLVGLDEVRRRLDRLIDHGASVRKGMRLSVQELIELREAVETSGVSGGFGEDDFGDEDAEDDAEDAEDAGYDEADFADDKGDDDDPFAGMELVDEDGNTIETRDDPKPRRKPAAKKRPAKKRAAPKSRADSGTNGAGSAVSAADFIDKDGSVVSP